MTLYGPKIIIFTSFIFFAFSPKCCLGQAPTDTEETVPDHPLIAWDKLVIEQKQAELDQWNLKLALDKNATSGHNDEHGEDHPVVVLDMQVIDQKTKELDEWKVKLEDDIKATNGSHDPSHDKHWKSKPIPPRPDLNANGQQQSTVPAQPAEATTTASISEQPESSPPSVPEQPTDPSAPEEPETTTTMSISEPPETGTSAPGQPADPGATTNEAADGGGGPKRESSDVVQEADGVTVTPSQQNEPDAAGESTTTTTTTESPPSGRLANKRTSATLRRSNAATVVGATNAVPHKKWVGQAMDRFAMLEDAEKRLFLGVNLAGVTKVGLVLPPNSNDNDGGVGVGATPIPQQFDSRTNWAFCGQHFIDIIRDQSACSSCWAVAAGAMLTDRLCIRQRTLGEIPYASPFLVSETDILSCSGAGDCSGGVVSQAVKWVASNRVVSGSNYSENHFCLPYPFPPRASNGEEYKAPKCTNGCSNTGYPRKYASDKAILGPAGNLQAGHMDGANLESMIQTEIMARGPVVASMDVYEDLYYYKSGIYEQTSQKLIGGHAVRIIGWGQGLDASGNNQPYWLVANSWNTDWGEHGFFRIIRGKNECKIESMSIDYIVFNGTHY